MVQLISSQQPWQLVAEALVMLRVTQKAMALAGGHALAMQAYEGRIP